MVRIGVVGYGYWGPNVVRNFAETPGAQVVAVSDLRPERLELARKRHPSVRVAESHRDLVADPELDAIAIATPVSTHYEIALAALRAGKHVLVEKPLTASAEQALRLVDCAQKRNRVLMVDHTFVYTGAVRKIRELVRDGTIGETYYYDSTRVNLGLFQHDVNVIWDLAVHDLSIIDHVIPCRPVAVSTTGLSHVPGRSENIAFLTLFFDAPLIAHVHVNWLAPVKIRRTLIGGSKRMIVYDDMEQSEKVKVYDRGITLSPAQTREQLYEIMVGYRAGDMHAPHLDVTEALRVEAAEFVRCIEEGARPATDGEAGLRVVQVLEAASESLRMRGEPVQLPAIRGRAA